MRIDKQTKKVFMPIELLNELLTRSLVKRHVSPSPSSSPLLGESPEATLKGGEIIKPLSPSGRARVMGCGFTYELLSITSVILPQGYLVVPSPLRGEGEGGGVPRESF